MSAALLLNTEQPEDRDMEFLPPETEACFQVSDSGELLLDLPELGSSTVDYLKYCVVRNPSDLKSHVRRIFLLGGTDDGESLYGALIDLLIALGSNGESLRVRLLRQYRSNLSDAQYTALMQYSETDSFVGQAPFSRASVLTKGVTGTCVLIKPAADIGSDQQSGDPLLEAREYLEYSQIEAARDVLERAVLENPERIELQTDLLELYRAGRDVENFQKIYHQLESAGNPLSDDWSAVSEFLLENA